MNTGNNYCINGTDILKKKKTAGGELKEESLDPLFLRQTFFGIHTKLHQPLVPPVWDVETAAELATPTPRL